MKMKTQIKRKAKRTLSLLLTAMLVISTMVVSIVSVSAVGANNGIIPKGEKLYYDFSACKPTQLNYISRVQSDEWQWQNLSKGNVPNDYILTTTIESDMDFKNPKNGSLGQAYVNNSWKNHLNVTVPQNGQNLIIVSADGNSYTWSTYSDSPSVESVNVSISPVEGADINVSYTNALDKVVSLSVKSTDTAETIKIKKNTDFTVSVIPDSNHSFVKISYNGVDSNVNNAKFTASSDGNITVTVKSDSIPMPVTDDTLISVLNGSKVMFYAGESSSWTWDNFYVMNNTTTESPVTTGARKNGFEITCNDNQKFTMMLLSAPAGEYYLGHWASGLKSDITAGDAYIVYSKGKNINNFVSKVTTGNNDNWIYSSSVASTKSASTDLNSATIVKGNSLVANTTTDAGKSSLNFDNTLLYYIENKNSGKFYETSIVDGTVDTTHLEAGTYSLKTVLKDQKGLFVLADSDDFTVLENTDTVTINVPTVANATVKVTAGGQEYTSGTFDIQVGSSFTVNVTPATGYKFGNISYNNESYNNGDAITAVKDVTNIAVTVAVDTVNVGFTKLNNATINVSYINDQATSATAEITADTTLAMQKGTEFTVTVTPITDYALKSIAYGTATSSKNPATFTASADGPVTVTVEQTTPVVETVKVTVPFVENASVAVEYTNNRGAVTTTTITDANADIVMKKDTDFTVTLNVNSGYKCDTITMTYASLSKSDNPATFTASTNGKLTITADISQTLTGEATIKFKSARSYMYKVSMSVNGAAATEMTRPDKASTSNDDNFGTSYTGTLTFCWYTQKITVTNGDTTTLNFKTSGTKLNAKVSAKLEAGKTYYFAVDDIAPSSNTEVTAVELPSGSDMADQMKRNYFHSARHLIYNETTEDGVLGFTNVNNTEYMIGELLNNSNSTDTLSVMSATAVQKSVTYVEEYSDLQNTLLDANMNGKLDVKDATLIQKAVVGLV